MNPRDFLDVADDLVSGTREADWRSAASRAYYAAFHVARRLLLQCGFVVPPGEQAHSYLWLRLANSGHPDIEQAGTDLQYLRGVRNRADYDLDRPFHDYTAVETLQEATDVVNLLETATVTPSVVAQITDVIRTYERDILRQTTWQE